MMTQLNNHELGSLSGMDNPAFVPSELDVPEQPFSAYNTQDSNPQVKTKVTRDETVDGAEVARSPGDDDGNVVEEIQSHLGGYGRYQMIVFTLLGLIYMRGGWHVWVPIYQTLTPSFHCSASPNLSLNESVPSTPGKNGELIYSECEQYVDLRVSNATEECHNGWTYMWDSGYTSIVSWMDLVCDKAYQAELTTTMYMVGTTCGVIFLCPLSDVFGAKRVMLACLWAQAVFGTVLIWAHNIVAFCIIKFFIGMCNMTAALSAYVLMTEVFDASHRELPTIALQFFWAAGIVTTALFGYLVESWQDLELTIALPLNILSISFIFIIPESLPWLLSKGKLREAESTIYRFIRINKLPTVPDLDDKLAKFAVNNSENKTEQTDPNKDDTSRFSESIGISVESFTILTLFKTTRLRTITLVMFYLFLVNALAYFGIMYSTPELNGDRFLNLCLLGLVEIPAYLMCIAANRWIGRRISISVFLLICAVCNLAVLLIPGESDAGSLHNFKTALVIIGKFGITGSYSALYLYASEVYPTVIRNQAIGASSFFENIGSIAAPNMVYARDSLANLPLGIFGVMTIIGCVLVLLLPETHNKPLPQTIDDVERSRDK